MRVMAKNDKNGDINLDKEEFYEFYKMWWHTLISNKNDRLSFICIPFKISNRNDVSLHHQPATFTHLDPGVALLSPTILYDPVVTILLIIAEAHDNDRMS